MNINTKNIKAIILALILAGGIGVASASVGWVAPTDSPNNTNAYPPINVSSTNQTKATTQSVGERGGLGVGTFTAASTATFLGDVSVGGTVDGNTYAPGIFVEKLKGGSGVVPVCVDSTSGELVVCQ